MENNQCCCNVWSIIQDLPTAASANALPRPDPPASEHLSSTAQPPVLPLPSLASTSCSMSEAQCGLMGLTFLVKYQGKSWKCPGFAALFLASWSPLGTVLSARRLSHSGESRASRQGQIHATSAFALSSEHLRLL